MKEFSTNREESAKSRLLRFVFNHFPAYRRSTGRVSFISGDWMEVHVRIIRSYRNRNYNGSVFGGSIYASIDPIYMLQMIQIFGKNFVVWDKEAVVKFKRPIKKKAVAKFEFTDEIISTIRETLKREGEYSFNLPVEFVDDTGFVYAEIDKMLYIATKEFYKIKIEKKKQELAEKMNAK